MSHLPSNIISIINLSCRSAWFFLAFKQRIVDRIMKSAKGRGPGDEDNLARIVYPLSTLISWATVVASSLFSLHALGVDVQPLLALGSVSTLAIGFAAQSTVSNVLSAFSLYAARPFIAGDRVVLKSMSGATVTSGTVQRIAPMHTVIKTDAGMPM